MKHKGQAGYTLVELLLVIFLLAMFSALAYPLLAEAGSGRQLEVTARALAADMRRSRHRAIALGHTQRLEFRVHNDDYHLRDAVEGRLDTIKLPPGITYLAVNFPASGGYRLLSFNRNGAPNRGGTVALADGSGRVLYVIVAPATGRVRVDDEPPDY